MIQDLDLTVQELLDTQAQAGSELESASISFDLPDSTWRSGLSTLTVNCYLYDIQENLERRRVEPLLQRSADGTGAVRRKQPARIDCAYCITAWSPATTVPVLEEHRLLWQVLEVLLKNPTIPPGVLQGSLVTQIPPFPTVIASADGIKNQPDFWGALDQQLKPSLNYVITLAMMLDQPPAQFTRVVDEVVVEPKHIEEFTT